MKTICHNINPLNHNGTSQYERLLKALMPESFKIDERSIKDFLDASYRYGKLLKYYDLNNQHEGDWVCFWKVEMLTFLAHLSTIDVDSIQRGYEAIKETYLPIIAAASGADRAQKENEYHVQLIDYIKLQAVLIQDTYLSIPDQLPLKREILAVIQRDTLTDTEQLSSDLQTLISFHKEAYNRLNGGQLPDSDYELFFHSYWDLPDDDAFFQIDASDAYRVNDQILLDKLMKAMYKALVKVRHRACYWFDHDLATPKLHQPHIALFLTFLRLFNHARNSLNGLTQKHLEFYFEKVLCIQKRAAVPDDAHLIIELAQTVDQHLIEKGTEFIGGTDKDGRPLIYETLQDWFLNKTQVADIKTTYIDTEGLLSKTERRIVANPDVNLVYKEREEQPNEESSSWRSQGDNFDLPNGQLGFAIASPQLILREGVRIVDVVIEIDQDLAVLNNLLDANGDGIATDYFEFSLSSEEEWVNLSYSSLVVFDSITISPGLQKPSFNSRFNTIVTSEGPIHQLEIRIILEKDHNVIDKLGKDLNASDGFNSEWPILRTFIREIEEASFSTAELFKTLRAIIIEKITIEVDVRDIQENLIIQNDQGVFDGTQKFYPFGPIPEKGDHFYIGSTEVFQKSLDSLQIKLDWIAPPEDFNEHYQFYRTLEGGSNLLDPSVQIDFIDRAEDENNLEKVTKLGVLSNNQISGNITDVNGGFLGGIKVLEVNEFGNPILNPTNGQPNFTVSNLTGNYAFNLISSNSYLTFSVATEQEMDNVLDPDSIVQILDADYQNRLIDLEFGSVENETAVVEIDQNSLINITLFPEKVNEVLTSNFNGTISGTIRDIFTNINLDEITIIDSDGNEFTGVSSPFSINIDASVTSLTIVKNGYIPLVIDYGTFNAKFPIIDLKLEPDDSSNYFNRQFTHNVNLRGNISLLSNSSDVIEDVIIGIQGVNTPVVNNSFLFEDIEYSGNSISFDISYKGYTESIEFNPPAALVDGNFVNVNFDIFPIPLAASAIVLSGNIDNSVDQTVSFGGVIKVEDSSGNDVFLNDLEVGLIVNAISTPNSPVVVNPNDGTFSIPNVDVGAGQPVKLEIIFSEDHSIEIDLVDNAEISNVINVTLPPIDHDPNLIENATSGVLQGEVSTIRNANRTFLAGVKITPIKNNLPVVDQNGNPVEIITSSNGTYFVIVPNLVPPFDLQFSYADYRTTTIENVGFSNLETILLSQQIYNIIEGAVTDISETPLPGVNISLLRATDLASGVFEEVIRFNPTNSDGTYSIAIPEEIASLPSAESKILFYLGESFEEPEELNYEITEVIGEIINQYSAIDIRLHNKLNIVPLINQEVEIEEEFQIFINTLNLKRDVRTQEFVKYSPTLKRGFIRLTLVKDDFLHSLYQNVLITSTIEASAGANGLIDGVENLLQSSNNLATDLENLLSELNEDFQLPNTPYTPATNTIRLSYTSRQVITGDDNDGIDQYYHLYPFQGYDAQFTDFDEVTGELGSTDVSVIPTYTTPSFPSNPSEEIANGNLYIGLDNFKPGSNLSLLFQIQEGSEQNFDLLPSKIKWSYLSKNNEWKPFTVSDILKDTTNGLTRTGVVQIATARAMVNETTLFDGGLYWIRAATSETFSVLDSSILTHSSRALPSIIDIQAQVIEVQFKDNTNDLSHLGQSLPAESIQQLVFSESEVKGITQPYPSFNGQLPENGNPFFVRVSERLRHKNRAVQIYDYERLILARYPKIHRAKCLNHTKLGGVAEDMQMLPDIELAPGNVLVAVVPDISTRIGEAAAEPRFSQGDLHEMAEFLRKRTNLFVACDEHLLVVNPIYEPVQLKFDVQFKTGQDPEARRFDLDLAIKSFLAPWLYDADFDIVFGRSLDRSKIIHFIEQISYVDAIANLEIFHCGNLVESTAIRPSSSRSILTTVIDVNDDDPNKTDHLITPVLDICVDQD